MANDLAAIVPRIIGQAVAVLRKRAVMPQIINSDFGAEVKEKGDTIDVPIPASIGTLDVTPANTPPAGSATTITKVPVPLQYWRQTDPFYLSDKDVAEVNARKNFLPMQAEEAVKSLAEYINGICFSKYKAFYGHYGSPASVPFNATDKVAHAVQSRKILNRQKCPRDMRRAVIDFDAEANALTLDSFADVDKAGTDLTKLQGEIGRKYGVDWYADDDVPAHTTGAAGSPAVDLLAGYAAGTKAGIHIDGLSADPIVGDIFTRPNGDQHVITKVTGTGAELDVDIYPALSSTAANDEAWTFVASHRVNLMFHPMAFAFAMRPLSIEPLITADRIVQTVIDPITRIPLRLEVSRQHKRMAWEFDVLFGVEVVRPELGMRIIGQP